MRTSDKQVVIKAKRDWILINISQFQLNCLKKYFPINNYKIFSAFRNKNEEQKLYRNINTLYVVYYVNSYIRIDLHSPFYFYICRKQKPVEKVDRTEIIYLFIQSRSHAFLHFLKCFINFTYSHLKERQI